MRLRSIRRIGWVLPCGVLLLTAGCDRRYVIPGPEALRAAAELSARGVTEVPARDEDGRPVRVLVRADDDYTVERGEAHLHGVAATDAEQLYDIDRAVLAVDHRGDNLLLGGALAILPGIVIFGIVGVVSEDPLVGAPLVGPVAGLVKIAGALEDNDDSGDRFSFTGLGVAACSVVVAAELLGIALMIWGGVEWGGNRELDGPFTLRF